MTHICHFICHPCPYVSPSPFQPPFPFLSFPFLRCPALPPGTALPLPFEASVCEETIISTVDWADPCVTNFHAGSIPAEWSTLKNLAHLRLADSSMIMGNFPRQFSTLRSLQDVQLRSTAVTMQLSPHFSSLTNLTSL